MEHHDIALCNNKSVHMVQLPPAEPGERNNFETIVRLMSANGEINTDQAATSPTIPQLLIVYQPSITNQISFYSNLANWQGN